MPWRGGLFHGREMRFIGALLAQEESMTELCEPVRQSEARRLKFARSLLAEGAAGVGERSPFAQVIPWHQRGPGRSDSGGARASERGPRKLRHCQHEARPRMLAGAEHYRRVDAARRSKSAAPERRSARPARVGCARGHRKRSVVRDFKGWFRHGDGRACDPLTLTDAFQPHCSCAIDGATRLTHCPCELEAGVKDYGFRARFAQTRRAFASVGAGGLAPRLPRCGGSSSGHMQERIAPAAATERRMKTNDRTLTAQE